MSRRLRVKSADRAVSRHQRQSMAVEPTQTSRVFRRPDAPPTQSWTELVKARVAPIQSQKYAHGPGLASRSRPHTSLSAQISLLHDEYRGHSCSPASASSGSSACRSTCAISSWRTEALLLTAAADGRRARCTTWPERARAPTAESHLGADGAESERRHSKPVAGHAPTARFDRRAWRQHCSRLARCSVVARF